MLPGSSPGPEKSIGCSRLIAGAKRQPGDHWHRNEVEWLNGNAKVRSIAVAANAINKAADL